MKPLSLIYFGLIIAQLISLYSCGHIFSQPTEIVPQNALDAKNFYLNFMLETPLVKGDALFIKFPFLAGTGCKAVISTSLDITVVGTISTTPAALAGGVTDTRFYALGAGLSANTWYQAQVTIGDPQYQTVGVNGCVWFATTSSTGTNYITYDENRCFDVLAFAPKIDLTNFKIVGYYLFTNAGSYKTFGGTYTANFDITPSENVESGALIEITIPLRGKAYPYFNFTGTCTSISCVSNDGTQGDYCPSTNLTALPSSAYTCTYNNNVLRLKINQAVTTNTTRIQVGIANPNAYVTSSDLYVPTAKFVSSRAAIVFATTSVTQGLNNPLSLVTDFTTLPTIAGTNKLLWGVVPSTSSVYGIRSSGYVGCPIVLYASGSVNIYNTLFTSFALTSSIKALAVHNNLLVTWNLLSAGKIKSIIVSSITNNFPGTLTIAVDPATVGVIKISGVTDLSAATYNLGCKFSLDTSANSATYDSLSTIAGKSSPTVGVIQIAITDISSKIFANIGGTTIAIKKNMEYYDDTVTPFAGASQAVDSNLNNYNQIYSFWDSNAGTVYAYADLYSTTAANALLVYKKYFLGTLTAGGPFSAAAGVWPKPSNAATTSIQGLFIHLYFPLTAICNPGTSYPSIKATLSTSCSSATSVEIAVLLKVVFNNNVLKIPTPSFPKGAKKVGALFNGATTLVPYGTNTLTTTATLGNMIAEDTTNKFWHLSMACIGSTALTGGATDETCQTVAKYASSISGIAFVDTNIANYPSLYADIYVLDFIVCFKIANPTIIGTIVTTTDEASTTAASIWQLVEEGCETLTTNICTPKAGPGLLNGYVISGSVESGTVKTSIVNGYIDSAAATTNGFTSTKFKNYIPAYLRVGFTITTPSAGGSAIGVFLSGTFDGTNSLYDGLSTYADANNLINAIDTSSSVTTVSVFKGETKDSADLLDHWWSHSGFIISTTVSTALTTVNYYIPIQITFTDILSLNVAIFGSKSSTGYPINAVYRVLGSVFANEVLSLSAHALGPAYKFTVERVLAADAPAASFFDDASGAFSVLTLWDNNIVSNTGAGSTSTGCFVSATPATTPKLNSGGTVFQPSKTFTTATISSAVQAPAGTSCLISTGNTGTSTPLTSVVPLSGWGSAFVTYIRERSNIFSTANINWVGLGTNKCVFHTVLRVDSGTTSSIYTIFCTNDAVGGVTSYGTQSISLSTFTVPFYWGASYAIISKLNYAWSDKKGGFAAFNGDLNDANLWVFGSSVCTPNDISGLAIDSRDVSFSITLTTSSAISYVLLKNDYIELDLTGSQANTIYGSCTHASLDCTVSSAGTNPTFKLTNSGTSPVTLPANGLSIGGWMDTVTTAYTTAVAYTIITSFNSGVNIETCASSSSQGITVSGANPLQNYVVISAWKFMANQGARGIFSFNFKYNRIIRTTYDFLLNLGALAGATKDSSNYRCVIYQNDVPCNYFSAISPIDTTAYTSAVYPKTLLPTGGEFTYKCFGGQSPDTTAVAFTNYMSGQVERSLGGTKVTAATVQAAYQYTVPTPALATAPTFAVLLSKVFNTRGFDSDYVFSFTPVANNITTSGRIVVEFSQSIAPKLNKYGIVECYLNETPAVCENPEERRVVIWPTILLSSTAAYPYTVRIAGVTQPNGFSTIDVDTNKKIFFALDTDNDAYGGISEQAWVGETWDPAVASTSIASIFVHNFVQTVSKFRSSTSFTFVLNLPAGSVSTEDSIIWVQFPGTLRQSFFYGTSPSFTLTRVYDSTNTNLAKRSLIMRGQRVAVFVKADALNGANPLNYTLTISGVATPPQPSQTNYIRDDFRIFTSADNVTVLASTASGARNSSTYISWNIGSIDPSLVLNWVDPSFNQISRPIDVTIGTYQTLVYLSSPTKFSNTFTFAISGGNSSSFLAQSKDSNSLRAVLGTTAAPVYLSAKTGSYQGMYYLTWSSADQTGYSSIPNLDIRVVARNCTPTVSGTSFDVPYGGGTSDPIVVDFAKCIPATDVSVLANVTDGFNLTSTSGISLAGYQTQTSSFSFSTIISNYKVVFYAVSNQGSNGTDVPTAAHISFTMSGTNGPNINSPAPVVINLVQASIVPPIPSTPSVDLSSTLSVGCDQKGSNFFVVGLTEKILPYNISYIDDHTENIKVSLTDPQPTDPSYTVFGYLAGLAPPALSTVSLAGKLKAGGNYTVYSYCLSNSIVPSDGYSNFSWAQADNGGVTLVLRIKFYAPLTEAQSINFVCALAKALVLPSRQVLTFNRKSCPTLRLLQTNTTNTTNTTTTNSTTNTTVNATVNATYDAIFYIVKDYFATNDLTATNVTAIVAQANFLKNLVKSLGDSTLVLASTTISVSQVVLSTSVPVVNYIQSNTDLVSINATFNVTNMNGMVYAGAALSSNAYLVAPNISQLYSGYDGNGTQLVALGFGLAVQSQATWVNLTGLTNNTQYTIFYAANNMDITINGINSAVFNVTISTSSPNGSFGSSLSLSLMLLGILILGLLGMI